MYSLKIAIIHHFCYLKRYSFSDYFVSLYMDINHWLTMGRKKKSLIEKSPFKLRHRKLADGRLSLFLDRSVDGGRHPPKQSSKTHRHSARRKTFSVNGRKPCSMRKWKLYRKTFLPTCCYPTGWPLSARTTNTGEHVTWTASTTPARTCWNTVRMSDSVMWTNSSTLII